MSTLVVQDERKQVRRITVSRILTGLSVIILSALFLLPILMMVLTAFRTGSPANPGPWTLGPFAETMTTASTWQVTFNSLVLALASSTIALIVGGFLAWVSARTLSPLRKYMTTAMAFLIFLPSLFYGLGWVMLTRGNNSPLQTIISNLGLPIQIDFVGWMPMIFIVAGYVIPVAYMFMLGPIQKLDGAMDDAARVAGASKWGVLGRVTVPVLAPSMLGIFVLMTSYSFSAFELPLLFGMPAGIEVFSTAVFTTFSGVTGAPNYAGAASLSIILIVLVTGLVLLRSTILRNRSFTTVTGKGYRPEPRDFGRIQYLFSGLFIIVVLLCGALPLIQMVVGSFQPLFGSGAWSMDNYHQVWSSRGTWQAVGNSIWLAVVGGFITMAIATPLAYVAHKQGGWKRRFAGLVTWAPASVPGIIIGLALITAYLPIPGLRSLYGTLWFLLLGFIVVVMPIASRAIEGNVAQLSGELDDAARVAGAGPVGAFLRVVLRILAPSFFAGWFLSGLVIAGNLSLPALLSNASLQPVAVRAYNSYVLGETSQAAALFITLLAVLLLGGGLLWFAAKIFRSSTRLLKPNVKEY